MKYGGIWRQWVPVIVEGFKAGAGPDRIARFLCERGVADEYGGCRYVPTAGAVSYILKREGYLPRPKSVAADARIVDPDGDRLRGQWIDFHWAKM